MRSKIFNSMVTMFIMSIILCLSSCGIDKSKCTSDYVYYERVHKMYSEMFEKLNENQCMDGILEKYACEEIKKVLKKEKLETIKNQFSYYVTGSFFSESNESANSKFSIDGGGDPFLGTDEKIFSIAENGEKFNVSFQFYIESPNQRTLCAYFDVVLIYENGDWKVYDIISKEQLAPSLRNHFSLQ